MQNILFINYEFPPLGGGGGHASRQIAARLVGKGYKVSFLTSRFKGLKKRETIDGIDVHRIPTLRRFEEKCSVFEMLVFIISSFLFAPVVYLKIRPKIVVCFFSIPCGPTALLLKLLFLCPYVIALRGGDVPGFLPEKLKWFHRASNWLTRIIWWQAHKVTANSAGLAGLAKRFYPAKTIHVIPNGVDTAFMFERSPDRKSDCLEILTVGRLNEQKKIHRIIAALARLKQSGSKNFHLTVVGDGPERDRWENLAKDDGLLGHEIDFVGWCRREGLIEYYKRADVFVLASDFEGMPNVVLEAMASSLAIVATNAPGTDELVENGINGNLIDRSKLEGFDEALSFLDQDRAKLWSYQLASYAKVQSYTWDTVTEGFLSLIADKI